MQTLKHVLWIGGPPASGKTTVASRLARRHGLRWYNADAHTWEHRDRALAAGNPHAIRWEQMAPEDRGTASNEEMLAMTLHRERGAMIADDLRALPSAPLIVAEGTTVSPRLVAAGIADPSRAVWLLPTDEFRQVRLEERALPERAAEFYDYLATVIAAEAAESCVPTLTVDVTVSADDALVAVETLFADAIAAGPRVETLAERRALLRYANEAVVAQVRGFYARPWASGDAEEVDRSFICECGDTACTESVRTTVADAAAGPVVAPGHA